jgi:hypothetical protein
MFKIDEDEAVFEKMQLVGEAGSLLKIEEEIQTAIAEARTRWKAGPRLTQGLLFGGGGPTTGMGGGGVGRLAPGFAVVAAARRSAMALS